VQVVATQDAHTINGSVPSPAPGPNPPLRSTGHLLSEAMSRVSAVSHIGNAEIQHR
jgi:hypothetical protein